MADGLHDLRLGGGGSVEVQAPDEEVEHAHRVAEGKYVRAPDRKRVQMKIGAIRQTWWHHPRTNFSLEALL